MSTSVTFRTEESKRDQLDKVAESLDRNRNWVINQALDNYLELQRWHLEEIDKGIAEADAGKVVTLEQVQDHLASRKNSR